MHKLGSEAALSIGSEVPVRPVRHVEVETQQPRVEDELVERIKSNPKYQQLISTRSSYGWALTWLMMAAYYGFILLVAFKKDLLATRMGAGVTTWGIPIGLFVIAFTVIITGIYVRRANGEFDELTAEIRKEVL